MAKVAEWLKNAEGLVHFPVLKRFSFNVPLVNKRGDGMDVILPSVRHFVPGVHLLDPAKEEDAAVLGHTWINTHFADGAVEAPDKTRARLEAETVAAAAEDERRKGLLADAAAMLANQTVTAQSAVITGEEVQDELNTPLNQPRQTKRAK